MACRLLTSQLYTLAMSERMLVKGINLVSKFHYKMTVKYHFFLVWYPKIMPSDWLFEQAIFSHLPVGWYPDVICTCMGLQVAKQQKLNGKKINKLFTVILGIVFPHPNLLAG